jgi:DNA-binding NtrC family response regulator
MIRTSHALFPSVLVIDDNVHLLESYTALLKDEFQVYTATTDEEGLACLQRESIVLVRLGLLLFTMDRLEVLRRVKTIDATVPVIVITAVDEVRRAAAAFKLGARIATLSCCEVSVWLVDALLPSRSASRLRSV